MKTYRVKELEWKEGGNGYLLRADAPIVEMVYTIERRSPEGTPDVYLLKRISDVYCLRPWERYVDSIDDAKSAAQDHLLSLLGDILEEVGE